jgi:hypothetical protein
MTSAHNVIFNGLYNTTERISVDLRILDEQTMVILRCGAALNNSLVCLEKKRLALFVFSGNYTNCSKTSHIFCARSGLTMANARNFDRAFYKFLTDEY